MKKSLAVLLALVMVLGTLAGCAGDNNSSTADQSSAAQESSTVSEDSTAEEESTAEESGSTAEGLLDPIENTDGTLQVPRSSYITYPIEGADGVTLNYWLPAATNIANGAGETQNTAWAAAWQEKTGVTVNFTTSVLGSDDESFGLMTTSNELPDIVEWEWTTTYVGGPSQAMADGMLIYLDDYITSDGYAADLWQFLQDNPHIDKQVKTDDDHYYCFPFVRGTKYLQCTSGPVVRTDLFEAAGVDVNSLETVQDWHDALVAVKGVEGVEYPLICKNWGNLVSLMASPFEFRANMYVDYETGEVEYGYMQEGYKEFVATLQRWLEEGLIDPDLLSNETNDQTQAMLNGTSALCYAAGGGDLGAYLSAVNSDPSAYVEGISFQAINFPVMNEGDTPHYGGTSYDYACTSKASAVITSECEVPDIAAQVLNYSYSKDGHIVMNYGADAVVDADGTAHYSDATMDYAANGFSSLATSMANVGRANMSGAFAQDPQYIFEYYTEDVQKDALYTWNDNQDSQKSLIPPVTMTSDESAAYTTAYSNVNTYMESSYGQWFALTSKVEDDWDNYITTLESMGVNDMIAAYQAALDRYNAR